MSGSSNNSSPTGSTESPSHSDTASAFFQKYLESGSPFDIQAEEEENEDVLDTTGVRYTACLDSDLARQGIYVCARSYHHTTLHVLISGC